VNVGYSVPINFYTFWLLDLFKFLDVFLFLGIINNMFTTSYNEYDDDFFSPVTWSKIFRPHSGIHK